LSIAKSRDFADAPAKVGQDILGLGNAWVVASLVGNHQLAKPSNRGFLESIRCEFILTFCLHLPDSSCLPHNRGGLKVQDASGCLWGLFSLDYSHFSQVKKNFVGSDSGVWGLILGCGAYLSSS